MVKPLTFKGDKKAKKRKRAAAPETKEAGSAVTKRSKDQPEGEPDDGDTWVSADAVTDVAGPVIIVLPTAPPAALACDAAGKVFAMPVENMVEANPASAEPHDVRQVWVANRVVGTESFRFKGHHGRYLACDKIGLLSAFSEAVSPLESFRIVDAPGEPAGVFQIQTVRDSFLAVQPPSTSSSSSAKAAATAEVRGDGEADSLHAVVRIRMQARFKPILKASKEERLQAKISRSELEAAAGRRLNEDEVRILKRAKREGDYREKLLAIKIKNKHDKFA